MDEVLPATTGGEEFTMQPIITAIYSDPGLERAGNGVMVKPDANANQFCPRTMTSIDPVQLQHFYDQDGVVLVRQFLSADVRLLQGLRYTPGTLIEEDSIMRDYLTWLRTATTDIPLVDSSDMREALCEL